MSAARGAGLKAVADLLAKGASLLTFPLIARYAGPDGYGALGQATAFAAFLFPFATLGLTTVSTRFFSAMEWTRQLRTRFVRLVAIVAGLSVLSAVIMAVAAPVLNRHALDWGGDGVAIFRWGALGLVAMSLEYLYLDFLRSRQWYIQYSLLQMTQTAALVGAAFYCFPAGDGVVAFLKVSLILKIAVVVAFGAGLWGWSAPRAFAGPSVAVIAGFPRMIRFGLPLAVATLGTWFMHLGDRVVIGHFLDAGALGIYGATYALAAALAGVNAPLTVSYYPRLMRGIDAADATSIAATIRAFQRFSFLAVIPVSVLLMTAFKPLLAVLGGKAFAVGFAMPAMIVLAFAADQLSTTAYYILYCKDQVRFMQWITLGAGALNAAVNVVVVPRFGITGAAAVTLATFILMDGSLHFRANSLVPLKGAYRLGVAARALAASLVAAVPAAAIAFSAEPSVRGLVLAAATFVLAYVTGLFLLGETKRSDLALLARAAFLRK